MKLITFKSIFFGLIIGFLYAKYFAYRLQGLFIGKDVFLEQPKSKTLKEYFKNKNFLKYSFNSFLIFIFLISIFVLLYFIVKVNLTILLISFFITFWIKILYEVKTSKRLD